MKRACYRWEATSIRGFVQQLAVQYIPHGYWFYVTGHVPASKDPAAVDAKLMARYGIAVSKWTRLRRKRAGEAALHYLRCGRVFVMLATHGDHEFFDREATQLRDVRRTPIKAFGYAIGYRRRRASVRIDREHYRRLELEFAELARFASEERIAAAFRSLPFEPYAPVHQQMRALLRKVNGQRRRAGKPPVPTDVVPWRRRIVHPFGIDGEQVEATETEVSREPSCQLGAYARLHLGAETNAIENPTDPAPPPPDQHGILSRSWGVEG
jgi:hypothetical protein